MRTPRGSRLWALEDFAEGRGLEIGPLHNRVVWPDEAEVHYLDVFDRKQLRTNYEGHPIDLDAIPEIEYVLIPANGHVRTIPEAVDGDPVFDWVIASHVVEHVPDVIGWLGQVAAVTADGGRLVLVVPDKRFCFDLHRPGTTVGQMLHEHELGSTRPSTRAIYDYLRSAVTVEPGQVWAGVQPGYDARQHDLSQAFAHVERGREGTYIDSHVWVFTPQTFVEQMIELRDLGLSDWKVAAMSPTPRNELEFIVVLERLPRAGWGPKNLAGEVASDWTGPEDILVATEAAQELVVVRKALEVARDALEKDREDLAQSREQVRRIEDRLIAIQASRQWRAGNMVLKPARVLRSVLRK